MAPSYSNILLFLCCIAASATYAQDCQHSKLGAAQAGSKGGASALWPMDILHQRLELDLTQGNTLIATCEVSATPRETGLSTLELQLLQLDVDSVTNADGLIPFTHLGEVLQIDLGTEIDIGDTFTVVVHYRGTPATDPSGFGGFYFAGSYTYNLGVAFTSIPHSYGRAWFPCVDNFTERNTYEFIVRTPADRNAWCNGELVSDLEEGGERTRHWLLDNTIPAYLAALSSASYATLNDSYTSIAGNEVPVSLAAVPADTANLRASFVNLPNAFACFEDWFGAYRWNKVGYVLTPLGAMEHATSIHYPRSIANGTLTREDVMAHELGHEWFGNVVTCERAEEMYINEGFAEYLSYLFMECVYGRGRYMQLMRSNHKTMLLRAHLQDEGWWALADVPQTWTYGEHSYNKAAAVIHSMRAYLGDDNFRSGLNSFIEANAFQAVNSAQLRDHLTQSTGVDMSDFFADWIFQPGWTAFEVDSFSTTGSGPTYPTIVHVQQKVRGPAQPYNNVPMRVTCMDTQGQRWDAPEPLLLGGELSNVTVEPPFEPAYVLLNADGDLSLAMTTDTATIAQAGTTNFSTADLRITVTSLPAPFPIRVEEYWVAADEGTEEGFAFVVSPDRWWRVVGPIPEGTEISGRIQYDGRPISSGSFDIGLMQDADGVGFREDSLVLLYRPDQRSLWRIHPDFAVSVLGNATDGLGRIDFNGLQEGEYTLGWRKSAVAVDELARQARAWTIHPNPSSSFVQVRWEGEGVPTGVLQLIDQSGRLALEVPCSANASMLDLRTLTAGNYILRHSPVQGEPRTVDRVIFAR